MNKIEETAKQDPDATFDGIKDLTWKPWVGEKYLEQGKRLLIVGQSHYSPKNSDPNKIHFLFTYNVVKDLAIESNKKRGLFRHLNNNFGIALAGGKKKLSKTIFWNQVAFYNFVQRKMSKKNNGKFTQPSKEDYLKGWSVFFDTIKVSKPTACLFIGLSAQKYLSEPDLRDSDLKGFTLSEKKRVGNLITIPIRYSGSESTLVGFETVLLFIPHTSSRTPWKNELHNLLNGLDWLKDSYEKELAPNKPEFENHNN